MNDQHHAVVTLPTVCAITKFNQLVLLGEETVLYCENGNKHISRLRLKCDGTCAETRFRLSTKRTSPFKSAGEGSSVQSTTGRRGVGISGSNAGYTMFRGSVKGTGYPRHSSFSPSIPNPCVTVCHHISSGLYNCRYFVCTLLQDTVLSSGYAYDVEL
jgi:hypothetical protein